jgi:hypothetical protein
MMSDAEIADLAEQWDSLAPSSFNDACSDPGGCMRLVAPLLVARDLHTDDWIVCAYVCTCGRSWRTWYAADHLDDQAVSGPETELPEPLRSEPLGTIRTLTRGVD